jgi:cysteine desulfurase
MEANGIYATSGAACTEGKSPSHVLLAMGLAAEDAFSSVRFALSRYNTEAEIADAAAVITLMVSHMRAGMYQTLKAHA